MCILCVVVWLCKHVQAWQVSHHLHSPLWLPDTDPAYWQRVRLLFGCAGMGWGLVLQKNVTLQSKSWLTALLHWVDLWVYECAQWKAPSWVPVCVSVNSPYTFVCVYLVTKATVWKKKKTLTRIYYSCCLCHVYLIPLPLVNDFTVASLTPKDTRKMIREKGT